MNSLDNQRFGRLVVASQSEAPAGRENEQLTWWRCLCDCGEVTILRRSSLVSKRGTRSCGCLSLENRKRGGNSRKHGMSGTKVYKTWSKMKARCHCESDLAYLLYGGRGISVCKEWRDSFQAFYDYISDPPTPIHSIDRIDNDGNYEPGNVRWATHREQMQNTSRNFNLEYDGKCLCLSEWGRVTGIEPYLIRYRIKAGWSAKRALTEKPVPRPEVIINYDGKSMNISQWSKRMGIKVVTIRARLNRGWSTEKSLTTPVIESPC